MKFEPFKVGNWYRTLGGKMVCIKGRSNTGTPYESVYCIEGVHRYSNRPGDYGRVTASPHDFSDPRNIIPLYTKE